VRKMGLRIGIFGLGVAAVLGLGFSRRPADSAGRPIVLSGGTLIDGNGGPPQTDMDVVVLEDRIAAVGPRGTTPIPAGAMTLDLRGRTVLPGFMNAHAHYTHVVSNLFTWGREGVTTVRNLVCDWAEYQSCKAFIRQWSDPRIPRVLFTGPCLDVPGGRWYPYRTNGYWLTSIEDARAKVNFILDNGADLIKVYLEDGSAWGESYAVMPPEMLRAIVETAHARKARVTAHVQVLRILEMALDCGVDDIAHSILDRLIPEDVIARMVQSDTYLVPTLEIYGPGGLRTMAQANLKRLVDGGVHVALGTDFEPGLQTGMPSIEMQLMLEAGLTPMQMIVAATKHAAHVCGLDAELGTAEPGKIADILVVDGDPLVDVNVLKNNRILVIHNGLIAFSRLTSRSITRG
jgi:imidazolonepropionase-like amidohydrolase